LGNLKGSTPLRSEGVSGLKGVSVLEESLAGAGVRTGGGETVVPAQLPPLAPALSDSWRADSGRRGRYEECNFCLCPASGELPGICDIHGKVKIREIFSK
jgi:hypothetical protein